MEKFINLLEERLKAHNHSIDRLVLMTGSAPGFYYCLKAEIELLIQRAKEL